MEFTDRDGFIVRILHQRSGAAVGVGFVVADRRLVTCAHVVNVALDRNRLAQDQPPEDVQLMVDFPLLPHERKAPARFCQVKAWMPPRPAAGGVSGGDVAGLLIADDALPPGAGPARLQKSKAEQDIRANVFGFPSSKNRPNGAWVSLWLRGIVGGGFIQLDADSGSTLHVEPGYSGSPVVVTDQGRDTVAGMLAVVGGRENAGDAYALPMALLAPAWPDVLPEHTPAGDGSMLTGNDGATPAPAAAAAPARQYRDFANTFKAPAVPPPEPQPQPSPVLTPQFSSGPVIAPPTLAQVIMGTWAIEISMPTFVMPMVLSLGGYPNGQLTFSGYFPTTGEQVEGYWAISGNQIRLSGRRMVSVPFPQQAPYEVAVAFGSWSQQVMVGVAGDGGRVVWRRQA
jgi:Trypsin-like peptidase domain